jgi:hypothetical protein
MAIHWQKIGKQLAGASILYVVHQAANAAVSSDQGSAISCKLSNSVPKFFVYGK